MINYYALMDKNKRSILNDSDCNNKDPGAHYRFEYKGIKLDPARIGLVYSLSGLPFTILKKVLRLGTAHKDKRQDLLDIKCAVERMLEMMDEDGV